MKKLYIVTDDNDRSVRGRYWYEGAVHTSSGNGGLWGPGWIHCYSSPIVAAFLAPVYDGPQGTGLWICRGQVETSVSRSVFGVRHLTAVTRVKMPKLSDDQRIHLAIIVSREAYPEPHHIEMTERWLDENRPTSARKDIIKPLDNDPNRHTASEAKAPSRSRTDEERESAFFTESALGASGSSRLIPLLCAQAVASAVQGGRRAIPSLAQFAFEFEASDKSNSRGK